MRMLASSITLALCLTPLAAQKLGDLAPEIVWQQTFVFGDVPAQKLSDLRGSVVMLEFLGTH
jgi:hypothetical protein